jgi:RNA polymerase sigma-70 factor (ECF subfamily)
MNDFIDQQSDAQLFESFSKGSEEAFQQLITRYKNGLYAFLKKFLNQHELIEDVFQETFLQLYLSRDSYDTQRELRPWLFTIAANKAKDALRKQQRTAAISIGTMADSEDMSFDDMLNTLSSDHTVPSDDISSNELSEQVRQVIADMPENLREILILAYFNKFSYKQMAQVLSIPIGTVKSRLHTSVARFAKDWKNLVRSKDQK